MIFVANSGCWMQPKQNKRTKASVDTSVSEVLDMNDDAVSLTSFFLVIINFLNNIGEQKNQTESHFFVPAHAILYHIHTYYFCFLNTRSLAASSFEVRKRDA